MCEKLASPAIHPLLGKTRSCQLIQIWSILKLHNAEKPSMTAMTVTHRTAARILPVMLETGPGRNPPVPSVKRVPCRALLLRIAFPARLRLRRFLPVLTRRPGQNHPHPFSILLPLLNLTLPLAREEQRSSLSLTDRADLSKWKMEKRLRSVGWSLLSPNEEWISRCRTTLLSRGCRPWNRHPAKLPSSA